MSEWIKLTPEEVDGSKAFYCYRGDHDVFQHGFAWTSTNESAPAHVGNWLCTDELAAIPSVAMGHEALRNLLAVCEHDVVLIANAAVQVDPELTDQAMTAVYDAMKQAYAALAALEADE